ncbi:glucoamylase family protein [Parapedobacter lycopersici]|uniref:glucoamylase family protein n=1 Tax=Parapedobacter lycopersici TaxID=1864939 RepID=UPI00333EE6A0
MKHAGLFIVIAGFLLLAGSCGGRETARSGSANPEPLTDDSLLSLVQRQTFRYFWEGAEPTSGLARERIHLDGEYPQNDRDVITIGGSGFGVMALLVGMERGFISKADGADRLKHIMDYLKAADRYHGAWPHWLYGPTGRTKSFSDRDDGGDLVETAFMAQALICVREYFRNDVDDGNREIAAKADSLWKGIDWDFYRNNQDVLFWHWSPTHQWGMNHAIQGYDECLITYVLAASSPTHPIPVSTYHNGWARGGDIVSADKKYGIPVILRHNAPEDAVGPLFWAHYSYLGLDPRELKDRYADYWQLNTNHALINRAHALRNPNGYKGYGENAWGFTASYSVKGYAAHHPDNDLGVISPTAALSSIPYTPEYSMQVLRYFYETLGDRLWGEYGFYDAYSETENWFPQRYLAIDQGPIVVMIENYRSRLLWKLFMRAPEIQHGLKRLGFQSPKID